MLTVSRSLFPKQERMVSRQLIELLFNGGASRSTAIFPLRIVYVTRERPQDGAPVQLLVSVSKKRFKHAVDRNRVKRQLREAYRRHSHLLHEALSEDKQLLVACVWLSDRHEDSAAIEQKLLTLIQRVTEKL
ncbi:MAG: ribonuclease P protein component [Prevotella sp.]|nr:ribonuclease P protein component [Prevotella sp.]